MKTKIIEKSGYSSFHGELDNVQFIRIEIQDEDTKSWKDVLVTYGIWTEEQREEEVPPREFPTIFGSWEISISPKYSPSVELVEIS
ncbi:hypothetical protein KKG81_10230, partial [bacterium]|nr:hypothetical protein [bacterium]